MGQRNTNMDNTKDKLILDMERTDIATRVCIELLFDIDEIVKDENLEENI